MYDKSALCTDKYITLAGQGITKIYKFSMTKPRHRKDFVVNDKDIGKEY